MLNSLFKSSRYYKNVFWLIIIVIASLAIFLRFYNLAGPEMLGDEGNYMLRAIGWNDFMLSTTLKTPWNWFADRAVLPFWTQLSFFDHPPLHFLAIRLSMRIFSVTLWAGRFSAAFFGVLSVILCILITKRLTFSKTAAILAGFLLAVHPWHIFISRQAQQESQIIFFLLASLFAYLKVSETPQRLCWWLVLGFTLVAGFLTKYSFAVIGPLFFVIFIIEKWWRKIYFWYMIGLVLVLLSPWFYYNTLTYVYRGHFDLQVSRLMGLDLTKDWPANGQKRLFATAEYSTAIINQFKEIFSIAIPLIFLVIAVALAISVKKRNLHLRQNSFLLAYFPLLYTLLILGMSSSGVRVQGSIIMVFVALAFGVSTLCFRGVFGKSIIMAVLMLAVIAGMGQALGKQFLPTRIAKVQNYPDTGFNNLERWLIDNQAPRLVPRHFTSAYDWASFLEDIIRRSQLPIVVADNSFEWFNLNWYISRYELYNSNYAFLAPEMFKHFLDSTSTAKLIKGKTIRYIESVGGSKDSIATTSPEISVITDRIQYLSKKKKIFPDTIYAKDGLPVAKVWTFEW